MILALRLMYLRFKMRMLLSELRGLTYEIEDAEIADNHELAVCFRRRRYAVHCEWLALFNHIQALSVQQAKSPSQPRH